MKAENTLFKPRILSWFSCGAASAVAAKYVIEKFKGDEVEIIYCDTLKYEHPDNIRFMADVSRWIGQEIKILKNPRFSDIMEVFRYQRYIVGAGGAPCTRVMKQQVRRRYSRFDDIHVFGFTVDEQKRIERFERGNSQLWLEWVLSDAGITKKDCYRILKGAGIELPAMYRMGYRNNNCIGCVKGGAGYWNKIRRDFPDRFEEMAALEKEIGAKICKVKGELIWLSDLPLGAGRYEEENIECGPLCITAEAA